MKRIRIQPGVDDPRTGRPGPSRLRRETTAPERLTFEPGDLRQGMLDIDGMGPRKRAEPGETQRSARRRAGAAERGAHWDALTGYGRRAAATASNLDWDEITGEFEDFGGLSEETYAELEGAGIPRDIVDQFIEGQVALGEQLAAEIYEMVGGQKRYQVMLQWAQTALPEDELVLIDDALNGRPEEVRMAVRGLYAAFVEATGDRPRLRGGVRGPRGGSSFGSTQELVDAIRDPRYKKDPGYRQDVEARLSRSNIFKR